MTIPPPTVATVSDPSLVPKGTRDAIRAAVAENEVVGIIGLKGSGKTTAVNIITRFAAPILLPGESPSPSHAAAVPWNGCWVVCELPKTIRRVGPAPEGSPPEDSR